MGKRLIGGYVANDAGRLLGLNQTEFMEDRVPCVVVNVEVGLALKLEDLCGVVGMQSVPLEHETLEEIA